MAEYEVNINISTDDPDEFKRQAQQAFDDIRQEEEEAEQDIRDNRYMLSVRLHPAANPRNVLRDIKEAVGQRGVVKVVSKPKRE